MYQPGEQLDIDRFPTKVNKSKVHSKLKPLKQLSAKTFHNKCPASVPINSQNYYFFHDIHKSKPNLLPHIA